MFNDQLESTRGTVVSRSTNCDVVNTSLHSTPVSADSYYQKLFRTQSLPTSGQILLIEDQGYLADCTSELIKAMWPTMSVTTAFTAEQARAVSHHCWYKIFIDLGIPGSDGLSLVKQILTLQHANKCCVVSGNTNPALIEEIRLLGLCGYIEKAIPSDKFKESLRKVMDGQLCFPKSRNSSCTVRLSNKQRELLQLLVDARSTRDIARTLQITEGGVRNKVSAIASLFKVHTRQEIVKHAYALGITRSSFQD